MISDSGKQATDSPAEGCGVCIYDMLQIRCATNQIFSWIITSSLPGIDTAELWTTAGIFFCFLPLFRRESKPRSPLINPTFTNWVLGTVRDQAEYPNKSTHKHTDPYTAVTTWKNHSTQCDCILCVISKQLWLPLRKKNCVEKQIPLVFWLFHENNPKDRLVNFGFPIYSISWLLATIHSLQIFSFPIPHVLEETLNLLSRPGKLRIKKRKDLRCRQPLAAKLNSAANLNWKIVLERHSETSIIGQLCWSVMCWRVVSEKVDTSR